MHCCSCGYFQIPFVPKGTNGKERNGIKMKNTKICPKCGSGDIIFVPGTAEAYGAGNNIRVGATIFSSVLVHRYVCCDCGYSEEWISKEDIEKLKKKYK